MSVAKPASSTRLIFFDNLRYLFVLFVVLQHSGGAYSGNFFMRWWAIFENDSSIVVTPLISFLDAFTMPLLFYIAGYFAVSSIQEHGILSFIKGKLKRLGIPWLMCILTICPVFALIYHYTRDNLTLKSGYFNLWITLLENAAQFNTGLIASMDKLVMNNGFSQRYMWFLSLLLLFFLVFSIIYKVKRTWFDKDYPVTQEPATPSSTLKLLAIVGLFSLFSSLAAYSLMFLFSKNIPDPSAWFVVGNIVQFQYMRLAYFIIYFSMGVITYKNRWIERGKFPGHFKTWIITFIILFVSFIYLAYSFMSSPLKSKEMFIYGFLMLPVQCFLTIATLGFFSSLAIKYWNRPRKVDQGLASASYDIYLSHYIFVLLFQLILFTMQGIPPLFKFIMVSVSSILCAYAVSRFLVRPYPKATIALLFVMLIAMFFVIMP